MSMRDNFKISGLWQRRAETAQEAAVRIQAYLSLVRPSLPPDLKWWMPNDVACTSTFDPERNGARLEATIVGTKDPEDDSPTPHMGFSILIYLAAADPCTKPTCCAVLRLHLGASSFQGSFAFSPDVFNENNADPRLITYDALRANMMALVWAFRPEYSLTGPCLLCDFLDCEIYNRPFISLAWMTWLEASLAKQVEPPERPWNTIVEPYSDGSLFMATGKERFSSDNDVHLRCARAIHRQIDFLNFTVPFEGKCGRNPRLAPSRYPPGCPY